MPVEMFGKDRGSNSVAQSELQNGLRVLFKPKDSLRIPVELNVVVEIVEILTVIRCYVSIKNIIRNSPQTVLRQYFGDCFFRVEHHDVQY